MTVLPRGKTVRLSRGRKLVCEIMHHGQRVPSLPQAKMLNVASLVAAREVAVPRPSWLAVLMRAYGLVAQVHPALRRAFLKWPRPRLYEHPQTDCTIPIERVFEGENVVLFETIRAPEVKSFAEIDEWVEKWKTAPLHSVGNFRRALRFGGFPAPLRRLAFTLGLHFSGYLRAKRFGTCVMSSLGSLDCDQVDVITPLTTYFTFGPIDCDGNLRATLIYDHRILDGRDVARCLNTLQEVLGTQIAAELQRLAPSHRAAA